MVVSLYTEKHKADDELEPIAVKSAGANEFSGVSVTELESRLQNPFTESKKSI